MSVTTVPESRARRYGYEAERYEPSVSESAERAVEAARGLVEDRLRLVRLQASQALRSGSMIAGFLTAGAVFLLLAWVAASVALALALQRFLAPDASAGCVALLNLLIGATLLLLARRRASEPSGGSA
jgi:hypothetical protein